MSTRSWALDIYCLVPYFILSCDGGGIRGLLPALLVQRLQRDLGLLDRTSLFAGTSAGGLISLALAAGIPVEKVVELFEKNGATIFTPFSGPAAPAAHKEWLLRKVVESFEGIWDKLRDDVESLFFVKYNNTGLKSLLGSMLPAGPLSGLKQVMVTTFQLDAPSGTWQPIVISNLPGASGGETQPIDAALCTSAAPTYFPPYDHPAYGYCVDGGVFANNPSALAIAMALQAGVALSDICVLSLGTGTSPMAMKIVPPPTNYGPLLWMLPFSMPPTPAAPLLSVLMDGVPAADTFQAQQLLRGNFRRANVPLPSQIALDDYHAVPQIVDAANSYMNTPDWQAIVGWARQRLG